MNLPNKLTMLRVILVPFFILFMELGNRFFLDTMTYEFNVLFYTLALIVFIVASFTDYLDGAIARKQNIVTDFGKFMDPLADKVLTTVALIYLMELNYVHPIVLCIVLTREFAVSGIRMIAASSPNGAKVIPASMWGKVKTVLQMVSIILALSFRPFFYMYQGALPELAPYYAIFSIDMLMWLMALVTVISGMQYIIPNIDLIKNAK